MELGGNDPDGEETAPGGGAAHERRAAPSLRSLMLLGPLYMLIGWLALAVFLVFLGRAIDGLRPDELVVPGRVHWAALLVPLWLRDAAGLAFALMLLRYHSSGLRARSTGLESLLSVSLSVVFKLLLLRRLGTGAGSARLVFVPIYVSMVANIFFRAHRNSTAARSGPSASASTSVGVGLGVSHLLAITTGCKLDAVSSYAQSSWVATLWPLWLGLSAVGIGLVMLACCATPFIVCFAPVERRGPGERAVGPVLVAVTILGCVGWACALVGCLNLALWLDLDPRAMRTRDALTLLAGAALCALLIGISLALLVLLQYTHGGAADDDAFDGEPAISLEDMMSRAVKPKKLIKQSSTLYRREEGLLAGQQPGAASDAPAADAGADAGADAVADRIRAAYAGPSASEAEAEAREEAGDVCWICESGPREAVFLECGHGGVCYPCAQKCWSSQRKHSCPMCRQPVTQVVRIAPEGRPGSDGQLIVDVLS